MNAHNTTLEQSAAGTPGKTSEDGRRGTQRRRTEQAVQARAGEGQEVSTGIYRFKKGIPKHHRLVVTCPHPRLEAACLFWS